MLIRVNPIAAGTGTQINYSPSRLYWQYGVVMLVNGEPVASAVAKEIKITEGDILYCVGQCSMPLRDETDVAVVQQFIAETKV